MHPLHSTPATMTPHDARERFRAGLVTPTAGWCDGYAQANLVAVPRAQAEDLLVFVLRNPIPCPVLDVLGPGETRSVLCDGDVRTDLPAYRVHVDGDLVAEPTDVREWWRPDMVGVLIGCSFTFERALQAAGVPVRHVEQGRTVPMYRTTWRCRSAGTMSGPLVVSMRPVPAALVPRATQVTARYPAVHGAPVHVGDPAALGIDDLDAPDYGEPVVFEPGDVPVFWACGVTPQAAVLESRPPLALTHAPGHMLVTDARDDDYLV